MARINRPDAAPDATTKSLTQRALRDPYYAAMVRAGADDAQLVHAGFFDDGLDSSVRDHASWDLRMPTTPAGKVRIALEKLSAGARPLVLLSTGAFSPVHDGHLALMEGARAACEGAGYRVVAGYLSPSHDQYVGQKLAGQAALNCEHRLALLEEAVAHSDWLSVCPWESRYAPVSLNFTDVLERLRAYLELQLGRPLEVAYVFGSDNAGFLQAFLERGTAVCVQRAGGPQADEVFPSSCRGRWLLGRSANPGSSSSQVRAGAHDLVPKAARARYAALRMPAPAAAGAPPLYLVRQDISHGVKNWPVLAPEAVRSFEEQLGKLLQTAFQAPGLEAQVHGLSLSSQRAALSSLSVGRRVLSLDVCARAQANLGFSRAFPLGGEQVFSTELVSRPGFASLDEQLTALPHGPWWVVDDDRATGLTERTVHAWLRSRGHEVQGFRYLNDLLLKAQGLQDRAVLDVVDARDFLLGSADGGLVVRRADGRLARAPYMLPFVNLVFRAKIPPAAVFELCRNLWQLNASWFRDFAPQLTVRQADTGSRSLLRTMGFSAEASLAVVASQVDRWLGSCAPQENDHASERTAVMGAPASRQSSSPHTRP